MCCVLNKNKKIFYVLPYKMRCFLQEVNVPLLLQEGEEGGEEEEDVFFPCKKFITVVSICS